MENHFSKNRSPHQKDKHALNCTQRQTIVLTNLYLLII